MLSSFATTETNEQLKDDEKKGKQPGNGIHQPKKKTARDRDPRTREQTGRDRGPRTREQTARDRDPQDPWKSAMRECRHSTCRTRAQREMEYADEIIRNFSGQRGTQVKNVCCELFRFEYGIQFESRIPSDKINDGRDEA